LRQNLSSQIAFFLNSSNIFQSFQIAIFLNTKIDYPYRSGEMRPGSLTGIYRHKGGARTTSRAEARRVSRNNNSDADHEEQPTRVSRRFLSQIS
jgi:hypothetical protein